MTLDPGSVARALGGSVSGQQVLAPGPGHSHTDRSLCVKIDPDAQDGFTCHSFAGDDWITCKEYVREKLGLPAWKPNSNGKAHTARPQPAKAAKAFGDRHLIDAGYQQTKVYPYTGADSVLLYQVLRYEHPTRHKQFLQRRPNGNGAWLGDAGTSKVLYRVQNLATADAGEAVFVTEGEKDADRLAALNLLAVTVASGSWRGVDLELLHGRDCYVMQDNDDAGRKKALAAADAIASTANSVRIVLLPGLPGSGDVSDWLDAGRTVAELQEICRETLAWTPEAGAPKVQGQKKPKDAMLHFECMADIDSEPVEWIWPGYIARGKLTLVAGDPGIGKSQLATDIAARITKGAPFPNTGAGAVGSVLMLSAEDGASDTLRPRLEAANSDLAKVHVLRAVEADDGKQRTFSLQADLASLGEKVTAIGDVNLVIIDPITSYMGMIDGHRTTDVRAVLEPLAAFAERHNVAVLAISHPPKATQAKALHAVTGSLAFVAAARLVFLAIEEPETTTGRRLLLAVKNNLGPKAKGLGFRLEHRIVKKGIAASRVTFDTVPVTLTADQALATAGAGTTTKALNEAVEFLKLELGEGPRTAKELKASAGEAGISWSTVRRAQEKLGIKPVKAGLNDGWEWNLPKNAPEGDQPDSEGVQFQAVSAFEDA